MDSSSYFSLAFLTALAWFVIPIVREEITPMTASTGRAANVAQRFLNIATVLPPTACKPFIVLIVAVPNRITLSIPFPKLSNALTASPEPTSLMRTSHSL